MRPALAPALAALLAACARPTLPPPAATAPAPPARIGRTAIGPVLVDARGMTLYTFARDRPGMSRCNGPCAVRWAPFRAPPGARDICPWWAIRRADGTLQWAYNGKPLYRWRKDRAPGDATGEGVGTVWHVARP